VSLAVFAGADGLTQQEKAAFATKREIEALEKQVVAAREQIVRLNEIGGPEVEPAIAAFEDAIRRTQSRIRELKGEMDNLPDAIPTTAMDQLRQRINATKNATADLYAETIKLFEQQDASPFEGLESEAAKVSKAYRLIGDAVSASRVDPGGEDTLAKTEQAAAAINELKAAGETADLTLESMKQTLATVFDEQAKGGSDINIVPTIDENGVRGFTDKATQDLQAAMAGQSIVIAVDADTSAAERKIAALRRMQDSLANAPAGFAPLAYGSGENINSQNGLQRELEKRGGK
jgi:hypothetical protein